MSGELVYLTREEIRSIAPSPSEVLEALRSMFREKAEGAVEMPPKPGIHPREDSFLHAMPAYVPSLGSAGIKWVSAYPGNPARGLPQIDGLIVLNDPATGSPTAILDAGWITAARTAAASAIAAQSLARPESATLGILGCGVQGRSHLEAFSGLFSICEVLAYDIDPRSAERFCEEMASGREFSMTPVSAARDAVDGADMVVTAGPITRPAHGTIEADWVRPGAFASSVDFASFWSAGALAQFDRIVTDDLVQFASYRAEGYFAGMSDPDSDLASLVVGACSGRCDRSERTFACNLGLAAADMAVAPLVVERARAAGVGRRLPR